jgi:hypothetical protein
LIETKIAKADTTHVERTRDRGDWDSFSPLGYPRHQRERGPLEKTIMMLKTKNHERSIHPSRGKIRNHPATPNRGNWKASETPGSDLEHVCQSTTFESMEYTRYSAGCQQRKVDSSQKIRPEFKEPKPNYG